MKRLSYNSGDEILEIIIRDPTGAKIDHFKVNLKDHEGRLKIFKIINEKYGIRLKEPEPKGEGFFDF